jgi:hypothetical protein
MYGEGALETLSRRGIKYRMQDHAGIRSSHSPSLCFTNLVIHTPTVLSSMQIDMFFQRLTLSLHQASHRWIGQMLVVGKAAAPQPVVTRELPDAFLQARSYTHLMYSGTLSASEVRACFWLGIGITDNPRGLILPAPRPRQGTAAGRHVGEQHPVWSGQPW